PRRADQTLARGGPAGEPGPGGENVAPRDERGNAPEEPGIYYVAHRRTRDLFDGVPQVRRTGIGVTVLAQVVADAVAVGLGAEVLLEHAQHGRALFVRETGEHSLR